MKSKIKNAKLQPKEKPFPKLMISKNGTVAFFNESKKGICLYQDEDTIHSAPLGTTFNSEDVNFFKFQDFDGKVILEND